VSPAGTGVIGEGEAILVVQRVPLVGCGSRAGLFKLAKSQLADGEAAGFGFCRYGECWRGLISPYGLVLRRAAGRAQRTAGFLARGYGHRPQIRKTRTAIAAKTGPSPAKV